MYVCVSKINIISIFNDYIFFFYKLKDLFVVFKQ